MRDDHMMLGVDGDLEVVAYDARASAARRHRTGIRIGQRYLHAPFRVLVNGGRSKWAHPTCRCMAYIRPQTRSGSTSELGSQPEMSPLLWQVCSTLNSGLLHVA